LPYTKGLHEVGDGVWAYLQPDGGWGWSNAGLVGDGGESLLVDTLFDLPLTAEMLDTMRQATPDAARIGTLVNTHANGDHCYGNALLADAEIVATTACAEEMAEVPPSLMDTFLNAAGDLGLAGTFVAEIFGPFTFSDNELVAPTLTFDGSLDLKVGGKVVHLLEVGPAHTRGDTIVHVPDDGVMFTGDILFHGGHPIVWAGPVANWIAACDRILAIDDVTMVVPGHGPLADCQAVEDLKGYFDYLTVEVRQRFDAGLSVLDAARDIDLGPYADWGDAERLAVNVNTLYRDFGGTVATDAVTLFGLMAELR
jgi:glyoxylase-like metal-dependent hydrolase (beta-lactamase superfamily II)